MGIYQNLFELIKMYIYGGVELTPSMELTATLISTLGSVFLVALPFILVLWVCKLVIGGWR